MALAVIDLPENACHCCSVQSYFINILVIYKELKKNTKLQENTLVHCHIENKLNYKKML